MKMAAIFRAILAAINITLLFFLSCQGAVAKERDEDGDRRGRVYAMKNQATGNTIVVYNRAQNGALTQIQEVSTGGLGSGPGPLPTIFGGPGPGPLPLNSQDSVVLTEDGRFLLAVNAGSNEISALTVTDDGLKLVDKISSGGVYPISIAHHRGLVYVVNSGAPKALTPSPTGPSPNIAGFFLDFFGKFHSIPNSSRISGSPVSIPDDLLFSPDGKLLILSELGVNTIEVFPMQEDGRTKDPFQFTTNNPSPFGIAFDHNNIFAVVEANEIGQGIGLPNATSTSSYRLINNTFEPVSKAVPSNGTAGCWIRFTPDGGTAYVVNAGSGTISSYKVSRSGELTLLASVAADTGGLLSVPIDFDITADGEFLYVLTGFTGTLQGYHIEPNRALVPVTTISGFPVSVTGLVAR